MTKIVIEYQDGGKVEYKVPDHIADAVDSLIMLYPHTILEFDKEQEDGNNRA